MSKEKPSESTVEKVSSTYSLTSSLALDSISSYYYKGFPSNCMSNSIEDGSNPDFPNDGKI
jgi:hypothetical protein